jgi:hypothetical protein
MNVGDGYGFRRPVSLMDSLPATAQPEHPEIQADLAALARPRHPRALEPLREDPLTGGLGDARADGHVRASGGLRAPPTTALLQRRLGVRLDLGLAPQAALVPQRRRRLSAPRDPLGPRVHRLPPPLRPTLALGARTTEDRGPLRPVLTRMGRIAHPSPRQGAPGTAWVWPLRQHARGIIAGGEPSSVTETRRSPARSTWLRRA